MDSVVPTRLGDLAVTVRGEGPAVLLWPSLLMDRTLWDPQVAHLAPQFRTIAVDPPGHGDSSRLTRHFTLDDCADAAVEVLDALGVGRTHWVGNSWGAMTGATFAARYPARIGSAVLLNGTALAAPARQRVEYAAMLLAARALGGVRGPLTGSVVKAFLGPTSLRTRPDVVRAVATRAAANDVRSVPYAVRSVVSLREDRHALLGRITTPVTVVAGAEDATFPVPELERMAAAIPGSRLVVLPDAAHLAALEVPERVNALLDEALG